MSMWSDYVRERLGDEVLECMDGFATYRYTDDVGVPTLYIVDIYVAPHARKSGAARVMADKIVERAKAKECRRLIGTVSASAKNATDSIKVLIAYGMEFYKSNEHGLIFKKEI